MDSDTEWEQQEEEIDDIQNLINKKIKRYKVEARRNRKLSSNGLIVDLLALLSEKIQKNYSNDDGGDRTSPKRREKRKLKRIKIKSIKHRKQSSSSTTRPRNDSSKNTAEAKKRRNITKLLLSCTNQNGKTELPGYFVLSQNNSKRFNFFAPKDNSSSSSNSRCITSKLMRPLEMDDILPNVFKLLDVDTLKTCRLVSRQWRRNTTREMLQRSYISVPQRFRSPRQDKQKYLNAINELQQTLSAVSMKIQNIHIKDIRDVEVLHSLNILGPDITHLHFEPGDWEEVHGEQMEKLFHLLQKLPHLQSLTTSSLDLTPRPFWMENQDSNWIQLLLKLESLSELRLTRTWTLHNLEIFTQIQDKLRAMTAIEIGQGYTHLFLDNYIESNIRWNNVQEVHLFITPDVPILLARTFLDRLAPSLKKLTIDFSSSLREPRDEIWDDVWYVPLSLTALECLHMSVGLNSVIRARELFLSCQALITALQLPKLKKIVFYGIVGTCFRELTAIWTSYHKRLLRNSVQELHLYFPGYSSGPSDFGTNVYNVWNNLKILHLQVKKVEGSFNSIQCLFSLNKLESLHLDLEFSDELVEWEFDTLLTGLTRPVTWNLADGQQEQELAMVPSSDRKKSMLKLICLKVLTIDSGRHAFLSDFFIYNALVHMKTLQHVAIQGSKFSETAIQNLRASLGLHAYIKLDVNLMSKGQS